MDRLKCQSKKAVKKATIGLQHSSLGERTFWLGKGSHLPKG